MLHLLEVHLVVHVKVVFTTHRLDKLHASVAFQGKLSQKNRQHLKMIVKLHHRLLVINVDKENMLHLVNLVVHVKVVFTTNRSDNLRANVALQEKLLQKDRQHLKMIVQLHHRLLVVVPVTTTMTTTMVTMIRTTTTTTIAVVEVAHLFLFRFSYITF